MKPSAILPSVALAVGGGAVGAAVARWAAVSPAPATVGLAAPEPAPAATPLPPDDDLRRELDELRLTLAAIERRLDAYERAPAPVSAKPAAAGAAPVADEGLSAGQQRAVFDLIETERERRAIEEAAEHERRRVAGIELRVKHLGRELHLSPGDEAFLSDLLIEDSRRQSSLKEEVTDWSDPQQVGALKHAHRELTTWRDEELTRRFGPERAGSITAKW
ncbi:MAG: hypothetical protein QF903_06675 [Planctomycetota bacterium]|nr:hypothetical protein [Planctomycetota bacterium]